MKLGLGLGLSNSGGRRPAVSGTIPPVADNPPGSFDGFEIPPTVETIVDSVVIHGKVKPGFIGKFVVPLGALQVDKAYNVNINADLSALTLGGSKAGVGFGFKTDNKFRLVLLQGNGVSTRITTTRGSPPNGWNKQTGHVVADGGATENGTQHLADVQLVINGDGTAYDFSTSGDDQENWDEELADQPLTPFSNITGVDQFGIAGWFSSDDTGPFSITVTWTEETASVPWTPAEISTIMWNDAGQVGDFTFGTGTAVAAWNDRSGNANHRTQGTLGNRPTRNTVSNTIGGLPVVTFITDDFLAKLSLSGWPANTTTAITCVCVARIKSFSSKSFFDFSDNTNTNRNGHFASTGANQLLVRGNGDDVRAAVASFSDTTNAHVFSFILGRNNRSLWIDGAPQELDTSDLGVTYNWVNMRNGLLFQDVFPGDFDLAEDVFFSGIDTTNRQFLEGYMAWKFGLEGSLVAGHPYENSAPMT